MSAVNEAAEYWDEQAAAFDEAPDHGLRDGQVREAWARLLRPLVPPASTVADLGCGTGSLSVLLAAQGHRVSGANVAPRMVAAARDKATPAGVTAEVALLRPGGRLLLVEGRWWAGGGLSAAEVRELVLRHRAEATVDRLDDALLWGGPINDERLLVVSIS